jgi:hypothetical protein
MDELGTALASSSSMTHRFSAACAAFFFVLAASQPSAAENAALTLAWDPSPESSVTGYVLLVGEASGSYTRSIDVGLKTESTVASLQAGTAYYFAVRAYDAAGGFSSRSEELVATTPEDSVEEPAAGEPLDTTPDAFKFARVRDVELNTLVTSKAITVSGISAPAPITASGGTFSINGGPFSSGPATVTNGQTVAMRVMSAGAYEQPVTATLTIGGVSGDFGVRTRAAPPVIDPPQAPTGLVASLRDQRTIELAWETSGSSASGYRVEVGSQSGVADVSRFTTGVTSRFALSDMPPGVYVLRVRGVNAGGASDPSEEVSVTVNGAVPGVPGAPADFHYQVQGVSVIFSWVAPAGGGAPTRYLIEATDQDGRPLATIDTGNTATLMLHDAGGTGTYVARVRAANSSGAGPASLPITVVIPQ